jgi:4-aminobutyrate aminotransferase-like enzyme
LITDVDSVPRLTADEARGLVRDIYGLVAEVSPLPSYADQNFRVRTGTGAGTWVLKIANTRHGEGFEMQAAALEHLASRVDGDLVQRVRKTRDGESLATYETSAGRRHRVFLVSYLEGVPMASLHRHPPELLESLGALVSTVDRELTGFAHPYTVRDESWDLRQASRFRREAGCIEPPRRRWLVERYLEDFDARVTPGLDGLPGAVIHNDGHPGNVLLPSPDALRAASLIDFGDMVETRRVFGLAIAAAYAALEKDRPLAAAASVVAGYHRVQQLKPAEVEALLPAMRARLAVSVIRSTLERRQRPDNAYIASIEAPAFEAMERLAGADDEVAMAAFEAACGKAPAVAVPGPEEALEARRRHLGPSLSVSYRQPLKIVRGWMQYLFDHRGRPYLDGVNNVCHVGHCHPRVVEAACRQMARLNTNTRYLYDQLAEYAERLTATLPDPLSVCYFVCSGSEANELALRLARTHTGRQGAIVVDGAYHGNTGNVIGLSPYKFDGPGGRGAPAEVRVVTMPDGYRQRHKHADPEAGRKYADEVATAAADLESSGPGLAAFFCESLLGCGGQVILPGGYLEHAFRHVRAAGGVCVADEVQTGFGRVGSHFWAFETQGVVPDVVTLGKPIGNGHPLAAVVTTPEIAASFDNGMEYFNTFGGNPVSCAVGLAVLDAIDEEGLQAHAAAVGGRLKAGLETLAARHQLVGEVRGLGLFLGVELVRDRETLDPAADEAAEAVERVKQRGILLSTDGPLHNVVKIKPPLPFAEENADQFVEALDEALGEVAAAAGAGAGG